MTRGWPLFVVICALAVTPLISRTLGQIAMAVLAGLYLLTLVDVWRGDSRKQASADRRSREAVQANKGKVTSDSQ